jgi:hypothetical protein
MMPDIKVTIEVQGSADEVVAWLRRLPTDVEFDSVSVDTSKSDGDDWPPEMVEQLVHTISPKARQVLQLIALGAPEVTFDDLQDALEVSGVGLGGIMASFGFAKNRGIPRPYRVDRTRRVYHMDEDLAEKVLAALRDD